MSGVLIFLPEKAKKIVAAQDGGGKFWWYITISINATREKSCFLRSFAFYVNVFAARFLVSLCLFLKG